MYDMYQMKQLEEYFVSKGIHPKRVNDVIAVLPYSPATDIDVPIIINEGSGEVTIASDVRPPQHQDFSTNKLTLAELKRLGQKINANPTFGRIKRNITAKNIRQARNRVNRLVGQDIL